MPGIAITDFFVCRADRFASGVTGYGTDHPIQFFKNGFSTPEAAIGKSSYGCIGLGCHILLSFFILSVAVDCWAQENKVVSPL
jgi:hypothetical protein